MKILWFMGPVDSVWNGVSRYSDVLIKALSDAGSADVVRVITPHRARSFSRYIYQFVVYPLLLVCFYRKYQVVVLYQEDLAFLIPLVKLLRKKVVIVCHHAPRSDSATTLVERVKILYLNFVFLLLRFADRIIVPSKESARSVSISKLIPIAKFSVVYNSFKFAPCLKISSFAARADFFQRLGVRVNGDEVVIVNVGTDESRKNLMVFLNGFSRLDQKKFLFVKVGKVVVPENDQVMREYIDNKKLNAFFVDYISDTDLDWLYSCADIYVSPSLHEGFGRTVIEAQHAGVPVLASKLPVYDEIMGATYFQVPNLSSPEGWQEGVHALLERSVYFVNSGIENSKRFEVLSVAASFVQVLDSLMVEVKS